MRSLWLAAIVAAVCGCATQTQPEKLSDEDRKKISVVRINSTVQRTADVFLYFPPTVVLGGVLGLLGAVVDISAAAVQQDAREQVRKTFAAVVDKNGISIDKIVREEVERALRDSGKVTIASEADTSAPVLEIGVLRYGFTDTGGGRGEVVPVLAIRLAIVDNSGKTIWSAAEDLPTRSAPALFSSTPRIVETAAWDQLRDDPQLIEDRWRKGASYLAKKVLSGF